MKKDFPIIDREVSHKNNRDQMRYCLWSWYIGTPELVRVLLKDE